MTIEELENEPIELVIEIYANMLSYAKVNDYIHEIEKAHTEKEKAYKVREIIWRRIKGK